MVREEWGLIAGRGRGGGGGDLGHGAEGQLGLEGCLILPTMAHVRALRAAQVGYLGLP